MKISVLMMLLFSVSPLERFKYDEIMATDNASYISLMLVCREGLPIG